MKKFKNKKVIILIITLVVLLCGSGIGVWLALDSNKPVEETVSDTYNVYVKDSTGASVEGAYITLYTAEDKEVNWLPYVSGVSGRVQFDEGVEDGCYVKVARVPSGYEVDLSTKYTFDENGNITIVLNSDSTIYVAKIGDISYTSFTDAITMANSSGQDVVIELLADVSLKTCTIDNKHGKNITINGNGNTITTEKDYHAFSISQKTGVVAFNNMKIKHNNNGAVVCCLTPITMNMTDVAIDATGGKEYNFCLFNAYSKGETTTLNLTRVDVKMAVESKGRDSYPAVIRTGNAGDTKSVNINLVDCNFDTTGATGRSGIIVMKSTTADIKMKNTTIKTLDAAPIRGIENSISQKMVVENCKFGSKTKQWQETPIVGYMAQVGNVVHMKLNDAIKAAEEAKGDVTIKLLNNINQWVSIKPEAGKTITIDGNGRTVNVKETRSCFVLEKANVPGGTVELKNMNIDHSSTGYILFTRQAATVNISDVNIKSTACDVYGLMFINAANKSTTNLNFTRVNANVDLGSFSDTDTVQQAIIRTGYSDQEKTVNINMTDCNFDATKASGISGIAIIKGTTATVNLVNSTISTKDTFAIRSRKQDINLTNSTVTSTKEEYKEYPIEGYETMVGDTYYSIEGAVADANVSQKDTTIKFVTNFTIKTINVHNTNGKQVLFDGNGKTLTTSGGGDAFKTGGNIAFKNMTINHKNTGCIVQMEKIGTLNMTDVDLKATQGTAYDWCLLQLYAKGDGSAINLTRVDVTMAVPGRGKDSSGSVIKTGKDNEDKTVSINLTDCNFDLTKATQRQAIVVMKKTDADICMTNTTIRTLDNYAIKSREASLSQTIEMTNCSFDSETEEFKKNPIKGYEAQIGDTVYLNLEDALQAAYKTDGDTTIKLLDDLNHRTGIQPVKGKTITIEGNDKTLTLTGSTSGFIFEKASAPGGTIEFKNLNVQHGATSYVFYTYQNMTLNLTNVVINAAKCKAGLIGMGKGIDVDLNLSGTKVSVEFEEDSDNIPEDCAVILTGRNAEQKNVNINIVDSVFDTRKAPGVNGIVVGKGTIAKINLDNSKISTIDASALKSLEKTEGETTIKSNCKITSAGAEKLQGYVQQTSEKWVVNDTNYPEEKSYTVEYNSNVEDGVTVNGTMASSSHVYGTAKALNANVFTRTDGYVFVGWNTKPDGSGTTYGNEASVMNLTTEANGSVTLYAQWTNQDVYTITYDLSGGTMPNGTSNPTAYAKTNESFTLYEPTRPGYTFKGWKETIHVNKWYDGYLDVSGNVVANPPANRKDSIYSEPIYIQGNVNYTLNAPGLTTKDTIRACMQWDSDRADMNILTKSYNILTSENGYMELLFVLGAKGTDLENVTITRNESTSDIVIPKGSTGNRHYEAVWEESAAVAKLSLKEEPKTKKLTLDVPTKLFDEFVAWIEEFANKFGWELKL